MNTATSSLQLTISPGTVYITTTPGQSSYSNLKVTVTNTTSETLLLKEIGVVLPPNLYQAGSLNSINLEKPVQWDFDKKDKGLFMASPAHGQTVSLAAGGHFIFMLNSVTLAQQIGQAVVTLEVLLHDNTLVKQTPIINLEIAKAEISSFRSVPAYINLGESAALKWDCKDIDYCIITPGDGTKQPATGSMDVNPKSTTIYTLYAYKSEVILSAQWGIEVANPAVISFGEVDGKPGFDYGKKIELVWTCNQFTKSVTITSDNADIFIPDGLPVNGNLFVGPLYKSTTFQLIAHGDNEANFASSSSFLELYPFKAEFTATPDKDIWVLDNVTLSWHIASALDVSIDPPLPNGPSLQNFIGSLDIRMLAEIYYKLTVTGPPGTTPITRELYYKANLIEIKSFSIDPNPIVVDVHENNAKIKWDIVAQVVSINQGVGSVEPKGEHLITNSANDTSYMLSIGTKQNPGLSNPTIVLENSYGPYNFDGITATTEQTNSICTLNVNNPGSLQYLKDFVSAAALYEIEITGAKVVGGIPEGSKLYGFKNFLEDVGQNQFYVTMIPPNASNNFQLAWTDANHPHGSFAIVGPLVSEEYQLLAEQLLQSGGFK